jgi:hypothetical protein
VAVERARDALSDARAEQPFVLGAVVRGLDVAGSVSVDADGAIDIE